MGDVQVAVSRQRESRTGMAEVFRVETSLAGRVASGVTAFSFFLDF